MRLVRAPDAFVRTYVGDRGRSWIVVRRGGGRRVELDLADRLLIEAADGDRAPPELRRLAEERLARPISPRELDERIDHLVEEGVLCEAAGGWEDLRSTWPPNLVARTLTDDEAGALRLVTSDARFACDGRGACCRLYDRVCVDDDAAAHLRAAWPDDALTPGGLTVDGALSPAPDGGFQLAHRDGACVALEEDGRCGVHARLGEAAKPVGCRLYPLRDVRAGDELHVGLAVECRCVVDFATAGEPITALAGDVLARRKRTREVEEVAPEIAATTGRRWPRSDWLGWRRAALTRAATASDLATWAWEEAGALVGTRLAGPAPVAHAIAEYLAEEARETARVYSSTDLQPAAFRWGAAAAALLAATLDDGAWPPPVPSSLAAERLLVLQALFTHAVLRSRALSVGLVDLALRVGLARAGARLALPPALHPVTAAEYLFRAHGVSELVDRAGPELENP